MEAVESFFEVGSSLKVIAGEIKKQNDLLENQNVILESNLSKITKSANTLAVSMQSFTYSAKMWMKLSEVCLEEEIKCVNVNMKGKFAYEELSKYVECIKKATPQTCLQALEKMVVTYEETDNEYCVINWNCFLDNFKKCVRIFEIKETEFYEKALCYAESIDDEEMQLIIKRMMNPANTLTYIGLLCEGEEKYSLKTRSLDIPGEAIKLEVTCVELMTYGIEFGSQLSQLMIYLMIFQP